MEAKVDGKFTDSYWNLKELLKTAKDEVRVYNIDVDLSLENMNVNKVIISDHVNSLGLLYTAKIDHLIIESKIRRIITFSSYVNNIWFYDDIRFVEMFGSLPNIEGADWVKNYLFHY